MHDYEHVVGVEPEALQEVHDLGLGDVALVEPEPVLPVPAEGPGEGDLVHVVLGDGPVPVLLDGVVEEEGDPRGLRVPTDEVAEPLGSLRVGVPEGDAYPEEQAGLPRAVGPADHVDPRLEGDAGVLVGHEVL